MALLPPIVLDRISTDWVLGPGNNLLPHYNSTLIRAVSSAIVSYALLRWPMSELATIKVSSKGQIVIPKSVRRKMGLKAGDTLVLARYGNALILKKLTLDSLLEESERNFLEGKTLSHEETFKGLT